MLYSPSADTDYKKRVRVIIAVILFMAGWRLFVIIHQPPHLLDVANEIGSLAQTRIGMYPNNDGSSLVYYQETEAGLGAFFCETATGKTHLLFEELEKGYGGQHKILGWSPDDNLLAFFNADTTSDKRQIIFVDGHTGSVVDMLPANAYASDSQFTWLSNHSILYSTHNRRSWLVFAVGPTGKWSQTQIIKRFNPGRLANLIVTSPHSIAWLTNGDIWNFDFSTGASEKIWQSSTTNKILSFTYSEDFDNYLLNCIDKKSTLLIRYHPPGAFDKTGTILEETRNPKPANYLHLKMVNGQFFFTINTDETTNPVEFTWNGMLRYYAMGGNCLFFDGNQLDDLPGIWEFDAKSRISKCIVPPPKGRLKYAKIVVPSIGSITNNLGKKVSYHLWQPVQLISGKKYPLILGQSLNSWSPCPQIAANGGYFFANTDLPDWINTEDTWPEEVMKLYGLLAQNPAIDTNQIYFIAYSAQAWDAGWLVASRPNLCHGLILFRPAGLPDLSHSRLPNVFITAGTDDKDSPTNQLLKFEDDALMAGVPVDLSLQEGVQHVIRAVQTERTEARQFAKFLGENK